MGVVKIMAKIRFGIFFAILAYKKKLTEHQRSTYSKASISKFPHLYASPPKNFPVATSRLKQTHKIVSQLVLIRILTV